jgi:hypothetical protein
VVGSVLDFKCFAFLLLIAKAPSETVGVYSAVLGNRNAMKAWTLVGTK